MNTQCWANHYSNDTQLTDDGNPVAKTRLVPVCHWNSVSRKTGCSLVRITLEGCGGPEVEHLPGQWKVIGSIPAHSVDFRIRSGSSSHLQLNTGQPFLFPLRLSRFFPTSLYFVWFTWYHSYTQTAHYYPQWLQLWVSKSNQQQSLFSETQPGMPETPTEFNAEVNSFVVLSGEIV